MAKRFTDSTIWDRHWFRELEPKYKLFWYYIKDRCDHAGIWNVDIELASFQIGYTYDREDLLKTFNSLIRPLDNSIKWLIPTFIRFQYGTLNPKHRVHKSVINLLEKERVSIDLHKSIITIKDKAKDKDKDSIPKEDLIEAQDIVSYFCNNRIIDKDIDADEYRKWTNELYKLVRIDKESWSEIDRVIRWVLKDDFWRKQVHTPMKFRKRDKDGVRYWDKLKALSKGGNSGRRPKAESGTIYTKQTI